MVPDTASQPLAINPTWSKREVGWQLIRVNVRSTLEPACQSHSKHRFLPANLTIPQSPPRDQRGWLAVSRGIVPGCTRFRAHLRQMRAGANHCDCLGVLVKAAGSYARGRLAVSREARWQSCERFAGNLERSAVKLREAGWRGWREAYWRRARGSLAKIERCVGGFRTLTNSF